MSIKKFLKGREREKTGRTAVDRKELEQRQARNGEG